MGRQFSPRQYVSPIFMLSKELVHIWLFSLSKLDVYHLCIFFVMDYLTNVLRSFSNVNIPMITFNFIFLRGNWSN